MHKGLRTWVEIDSKAVKHNIAVFRSVISKKTKLMAIVKSNAYGHGLWDFAKLANKNVDWFGVDSITEGLTLRKHGIKKPILVLGYTLPEMFADAVKNDISITISSADGMNVVLTYKLPVKIHLKIDTGMHRQGFNISELKKACKILQNTKMVVEGMYTHFASAKNPSFPKETNEQLGLFNEAIKVVEDAGFKPIKHASATGGTLLFPQAHYDLVRVGIGLYGMWPSKDTMRAMENKIELKPVLSWKTVIGEVKILPEGGGVGYDATEKLSPRSKIAICPIGYWHGYVRAFSSIGNILVRGERAKIIGRISMDMIVIDITKIKGVKAGDEVVIIGKQAKNKISADELADISGTINYEVVTRINPLIKRIIV
ncbi:MAG: alanine racemase [bacterium]|nr:alanine racemase [bacterium]